MPEKIFFNSSMPRAGSTLIQNIMAQNPDIYASPTSGLYDLVYNNRNIFSNGHEFKAQDSELMEKGLSGFVNGAMEGFYEQITDRPFVIDKCRGWSGEVNFLKFLGRPVKIIKMIRDPRSVFASMEKKFRKNPQLDLGLVSWGESLGTTTEKRIVHWSNNIPISPVMDRIYQTLLDGTHQDILFVKFENLTKNPEREVKRIYEYLELPYYENHDFNNVEQFTKEDDKVYGVFGDHIIRQKVSPVKEDFREILGEKGCKMISDAYDWFYDTFGYKI